MANEIKLKLKVDDDGNLKVIAKNSEKAAKGLNETAKSARTADRNLKGAAQASANSSKNFAKLTQGTAGLVGAYATLAASLFAVSAAYNFLKRAGELTSLQRGQEAYASATGKALRTLTNDIIDATGAQITFRDAAQAAAIGTAAGLGADQLERLGTAAKDASIVLGRDVTDSFNRLVRGVTKAEPELLDELGIILRLEDATRDYALQLGKSAKELTAFERSQAVANDVLTQAEEKYSRILEVTGGGEVNQFAQLGKAFDDIANSIAKTTALIAGPFAKVLTDIPALGLAAFGLLLKGPLLALGVNFENITEAADKAAEASRTNFEKLRQEAKLASGNVEALSDNFKRLGTEINTASKSQSKILDKLEAGGIGSLSGADKASLKRAIAAAKNNVNEFGVVTKGIFKNVKLTMVKEFEEGFKLIELAENKKLATTKVWGAKMAAVYAGTAAAVQTIAARLAAGLTTALGWLGWIGLAYTAFVVLNQQFGFFNNELSKSEQRIEKSRERLKSLSEEFTNLRATVKVFSETSITQGFEELGNAIASIGKADLSQLLNDYREVAEQEAKLKPLQEEQARIERRGGARSGGEARRLANIKRQIEALGDLTDAGKAAKILIDDTLIGTIRDLDSQFGITSKQTKAFEAALKNFKEKGTQEALEGVLDTAEGMRALAGNIDGARRSIKAAEDSYKTFINSLSPRSVGQTAIDNLRIAIKDQEEIIDSIAVKKAKIDFFGQTIEVDTEEYQRELGVLQKLNKELEFAEELETRKIKRRQNTLRVQNSLIRSDIGLLNYQKEENKLSDQITLIEEKKTNILGQQEDIILAIQKNEGVALEQQLEKLKLLSLQFQGLNAQAEVAQLLLDLTRSYSDSSRDIELIGLSTRIIAAEKVLLKVSEQRLKVEKDLFKAREDAANIRTERAILDYDRLNPFAFLDKEEKVAELRFNQEKELIAERIRVITLEKDLKLQQIDIEYRLLYFALRIEEEKLKIWRRRNQENLTFEQQTQVANLIDQSERLRGGLKKLQADAEASVAITAATSINKALLNLDKIEFAKDNLTEMGQITDTLAQSFGNGMVTAFDSVIQGTMSVRDAFKQMAVSVLQALSQIIAKLIVIKLLELALSSLSFFGGGARVDASSVNALGGGSGALLNQPGGGFQGVGVARYGGMFEPSMRMGGIAEGYGMGGIAKGREAGYPAILHGTEAVVPLPNGKEIPVQMMNGGGQNNNVVVNVNVDSDGNAQQDTQANQQQGANLGNAIAAAVQKELLNQKRSGGILNPYGVA